MKRDAGFFSEYLEALEILDLKFKISGKDILVDRDSICRSFPWISEHKVYDHVYREIVSYVLEHFYWMKLDDNYYLLRPRDYSEIDDDTWYK